MESQQGPSGPRVAVVAGGSRGIGRATVSRLAKVGYAVVVNYLHDQKAAESTVEAILEGGGSAVAVRADVSDEVDVERLFDATIEVFGPPDAVVHAVRGHLALGPIARVELAAFDEMFRTTSRAAFIVNREAARHVRNGGSIVTLTGSLNASSSPSQEAYATATAAIHTLAEMLALSLRERNITVNVLALDIDKPCAPERVADSIAYLLSDAGHGMTGEAIHLDYVTHPVEEAK